MDSENNEVKLANLYQAKNHNDNALRYTKSLREILTYMRNDHIGMLHGDGELTRYMHYLVGHIFEETANAQVQLNNANLPPDLPF